MIAQALERIRSYPTQIAAECGTKVMQAPPSGNPLAAIGKIHGDVSVISQHLRSHTELKHYVNEAQTLVELLGAVYHGWLVPLYRKVPTSPAIKNNEEPNNDTGKESAPGAETETEITSTAVQDETSMNRGLEDKSTDLISSVDKSTEGVQVIPSEDRQRTVGELEAAISGILECLTLLCAETDEDAGDVQGSTDCRDRRQVVRKAVPPSLFSQMAEAMIRKGVCSMDEAPRRSCVEAIMVLARALGSWDETYWLRVCRLGAECVECPRVRTLALAALGIMLQSKLALGTKTTAVKVEHELSLITSAIIDVLNEEPLEDDVDEGREYVDFVLSAILRLLGDDERNSQDAVDWTTWLGQLLDGRLAADEEMCGALMFLNLLHTAAPNDFMTYVSLSGLTLRVLPLVCKATSSELRTQTQGAIFLSNCLDFPSLRKQLLEADAVDLITPALERADDPELRGAVLAAMAKIALHSATAKELVLDTIPFYPLVHGLAQHVRETASRLSKQVQFEESRKTFDQARMERIARSVVSIVTSLSFHADFKAHVLRLSSLNELERISADYQGENGGDGGTETRPLVKTGTSLDDVSDRLLVGAEGPGGVLEDLQIAASICPVRQSALDVVLTVFNLLRSKHDRKILSNANKRGPDFDASQLKELEAMYQRLPEQAKVAERRLYDSGGLVAAMAIRKYVLKRTKLVQSLDYLLEHGRWSAPAGRPDGPRLNSIKPGRSLGVLASQSVCYLSSVLALRSDLIAAGGLRILLKGCEYDDQESRFHLCSLAATCHPNALGYSVRMRCAHEMLLTVQSSEEELPVCFAARGLVNFCGVFEDVCIKVWDGGRGWRICENLMSDWSDLTSRYGAELLCNLTSKSVIPEKIQALVGAADTGTATGKRWPMSLLMAYASDSSVPDRQYACLSTLYYLSGNVELAIWVFNEATVDISGKTHLVLDRLLEVWNAFGAQDPQVELRVVCTVINIVLNDLQFIHAAGETTPPENMRELLAAVELNCVKVMLATAMIWSALSESAKKRFSDHFHEFVREPTYNRIAGRLPAPLQALWTNF